MGTRQMHIDTSISYIIYMSLCFAGPAWCISIFELLLLVRHRRLNCCTRSGCQASVGFSVRPWRKFILSLKPNRKCLFRITCIHVCSARHRYIQQHTHIPANPSGLMTYSNIKYVHVCSVIREAFTGSRGEHANAITYGNWCCTTHSTYNSKCGSDCGSI